MPFSVGNRNVLLSARCAAVAIVFHATPLAVVGEAMVIGNVVVTPGATGPLITNRSARTDEIGDGAVVVQSLTQPAGADPVAAPAA